MVGVQDIPDSHAVRITGFACGTRIDDIVNDISVTRKSSDFLIHLLRQGLLPMSRDVFRGRLGQLHELHQARHHESDTQSCAGDSSNLIYRFKQMIQTEPSENADPCPERQRDVVRSAEMQPGGDAGNSWSHSREEKEKLLSPAAGKAS